MAKRHFGDWLKAYLDFTEHSEAPTEFHFWTAASMIAGALRRRVWIEQDLFQWTPNLYVILVAPPGIAGKSTTVNIGVRILREVEGVHLGPQSLTWQGLTLALEEAKDHVAVDEETFIPMSCLTCAISELGTFLKPKDTELVDLLVDLWDGAQVRWIHKTKTTGETVISNPWMNIIGCTTPAWLKQNFPMYLVEGGLTSRVIFVYATHKRQLIPYPGQNRDRQRFLSYRKALTEDLREISLIQGEYVLTPAAIEWGSAWYARHWDGKTTEPGKYPGYHTRKQTHMHKVAMIFAAAQHSKLVITAEDLQRADLAVSMLEKHMDIVFKTVGITTDGQARIDILATLEMYKELSYNQLMQYFLNRLDHRQLDASLESLRKAGLIAMCYVVDPESPTPVVGWKFTGPPDTDSQRPESPLAESS